MTGGVRLGIYEKALQTTLGWDTFFAQVNDAGFSFCDLSIDETPERSARLRWTAAERASVRQAAQDAGVQIGGLCLSLHRKVMPGSVDPAIRQRALDVYHQGIRLAADLGVSVVQVAGYYAYYEPDDPDARRRYVNTLLAAVPMAAREGVILAIENVDGHDIAAIGDAMSVVREIGSPWVQTYPDVGNIAEHGGDAAQELRDGEGHMVAIHLKDVLPGQPRRIPFGTGVADFPAAFAELRRQEWSGRLMLEMWNDESPDSVSLCREAREYIAA
ncbi:MAG: L-ribulose-5-phosphate 3-epimerase, partial [Actinobacteria bacterium]|nr:L-ribulose-5-phosphate 3-epimerase [Actinomycetota bacterium]